MYTEYVRPDLDYGIASCANAAQTNFNKVTVKIQSMRIITGAIDNYTNKRTLKHYGLQSMEDIKDNTAHKQAEKYI